LFVQILLVAQAAGVLKLGNLSLDGSKIHADASKSHAVRYGRLAELEVELKWEVQELLSLGEQADQGEVELPAGWLEDELNPASATGEFGTGRRFWRNVPMNVTLRKKRNMKPN
jgi:hypothetical protein